MGRISGRLWGFPVAAYGENLMATDRDSTFCAELFVMV